MKLRYFINKDNEKVYTLKEKIKKEQTKDAHYKFLQIKSLKDNLQAQDLE